LMAFLRASVFDQSSADDLFQETMIVAWQKIGEYDRTRPFGAWLRGIAKLIVLAHFRNTAREIPCPQEHVLAHIDRQISQIDRRPGDTFDEKIDACVSRLSPEYREPIDLHYQQSRTADWIANSLATTKEAIQKRLQRARIQIANCLQRKGIFSDVTEGV
jgi:RNA polymerase sigma factor (sigma-70 family)